MPKKLLLAAIIGAATLIPVTVSAQQSVGLYGYYDNPSALTLVAGPFPSYSDCEAAARQVSVPPGMSLVCE